MKEDAPVPDAVPKKRRQLEGALDLWLAVWLARDDLTPSERRRVSEVKQRRKDANPQVVVGFLGTTEGLTPAQRDWLTRTIPRLGVTEAHHGSGWGADKAFHDICRGLEIPVVLHRAEDLRWMTRCDGAVRSEPMLPRDERDKEIVKAASVVVAMPKEHSEPSDRIGVWRAVEYARHRSVPVRVIIPTGEELQGAIA